MTVGWGRVCSRPTMAHPFRRTCIRSRPARVAAFQGRNPLVDDLIGRKRDAALRCEDQCSPRYSLDVADAIVARRGNIGRIVEVGVFPGGASEIFAGAMRLLDCELDPADVDARHPGFAHERLRRVIPGWLTASGSSTAACRTT